MHDEEREEKIKYINKTNYVMYSSYKNVKSN